MKRGKTTLIEQVIPRLAGRGLAVSLVKHAHHAFDIDQPGKDSFRHRKAGCTEVLITSGQRWALMHEMRGAPELSLSGALARLAPADLVLVEGYKAAAIPKLEIWRRSAGKPLLFPGDPHILAVATDSPHALPPPDLRRALQVLALSDWDAIATFVLEHAVSMPLEY